MRKRKLAAAGGIGFVLGAAAGAFVGALAYDRYITALMLRGRGGW